MNRRWMGAALALALAMVAGCGGEGADSGGEISRSLSTGGQTLTVLDPNYEAIFDPSWSMWARFLVFSPLVGLGEDGEIEPRLARRWEHAEGYREWTFHLRTDVRWHDGEPFDADDVAFTERMMAHAEVAFRSPNRDTVIVVDDSTVTIRNTEPWDGLNWWWVYYPEHLLGDMEPSEFFGAEFWTRPVGTGPFRYVRHTPKTVFVLEANPDHYRDVPSIDRVRLKFGGGSPVAELKSGNVDAATYVSRAEIPRFRENPHFRLYHHMLRDLDKAEVIYWNHHHPFLAEAGVRRALTLAIDRKELHRLQHLPRQLPQFPEGLPVFDVFPTGRYFWAGELPPPLPHDPRRARSLLDSAGWGDTDGDGLRTRGGQEARFTALVAGGGSFSTFAFGQAAVYVQAALREIGVRMEIRGLESGLNDRIRAGEFDAAFHRLGRGALRSGNYFAEDSPLGYARPELHRIYSSLDSVIDPARRDSLYRETWPILRRDLPFTFLGPQVQTFVAHRRVRGLESPFQAHPYAAMEHLWLEEMR